MKASTLRIAGIIALTMGLLLRYQNNYSKWSNVLLVAAALLIIAGAVLRFRPRSNS